MQISTAFSLTADTRAAVAVAYAKLEASLGRAPRWLLVQTSVKHDVEIVRDELRRLAPEAKLHGSTSCLGVMTQDGFHTDDGVGLGLLGIVDDEVCGAIGVGIEPTGTDPHAAAGSAVRRAVESAGRPGEVPSLVWLSASPGAEETVIRGVEAVVGTGVPILGGSAADNTVEGHWKLFTSDATFTDAVLVTVVFPSGRVASAFQSGYSPTDHKGVVTRAKGRKIFEIDGRPAARVYDTWTNGAIAGALEHGGNILGQTSLHPLGRIVGRTGEAEYYRLAHPDSVTEDGGLTLFADVEVGDALVLMAASPEAIVRRAGRVAEETMARAGLRSDDVAGALVVFCAGCMLAVKPHMDEVVRGLRSALGDAPFLGVFTFGEQGFLAGGENRHGNLMISVTVFSKE